MTRSPQRHKPGLRHAEVSECRVLVDPRKSRRLREILNGNHAAPQTEPGISTVEPKNPVILPSDVLRELQQARRIIDGEIDRIMSLFPEGRKNSLFKIRFGSLEEIRAMDVQAIFKLLKLECKDANLNRLQDINYFGEKVS